MSVCILLFDLSKHILQNCIWCTNLGLEIDNTIEIIISIKIIPLALSKPRLVISQVFHAYFICLAVKIETFILTLNIETEPGLGSNISERPFIFEKFKFFQFFLYSLLIVWIYWRTEVRKNYEQSQSLYIKIYKKKTVKTMRKVHPNYEQRGQKYFAHKDIYCSPIFLLTVPAPALLLEPLIRVKRNR